MKRWSLMSKMGVVIGLTLLMLVPINMIMDVIDDRHSYQLEVIEQIANSVGGKQKIVGPILVQPYILHTKEVIKGKVIKRDYAMQKYILPENLQMKGDLNVEKRRLSIYGTQVYKSDISFSGQFPALDIEAVKDKITLKAPYLVVAVKDLRGIINTPQLTINQQSFNFEPGVADSRFTQGIHAQLPVALTSPKKALDFQFTVSIQGGQFLSVVPVGKVSTLALSANWPHPNFLGEFLPIEKTIGEQGFSASWKSSWFANNINALFERYEDKDMPYVFNKLPGFNVNLIELVDEYQINARSVKYAVLFIGLTFVAFFLFEIMKGLRIHPVQYLLVGIAQALFYLILLALSEHIGFNLAYAGAAVACSGLISFYLSAVLKGVLRGLSFGFGLLLLYAVLFGLLQSENMALLLGSLVLFVILGVIMALTRHLDWYSFAQNIGEKSSGLEAEIGSDSGGGVLEHDDESHREIIEEIDRKSCRLWK